jgi:biopolymer transport protein ExbB
MSFLRRPACLHCLAGVAAALVPLSSAWAQEALPPPPTETVPVPPDALPAMAGVLPADLSPWGMFLNADIIVQGVMIGLAFASVVTWTVWLAKSLELTAARRRIGRALRHLGGVGALAEAVQAVEDQNGAAAMLVRAAETELRLSQDMPGADGIKERVASRLERLSAAAGRSMMRGTGVLATIGATAPFVGLFGTVWGIMNAFVGISKAQTTNLAVVAPGIAEALLATAIGLVAAIPAVVIYNVFARAIAGYRAQIADVAAEVLRLVSRDLDRAASSRRYAKAAE